MSSPTHIIELTAALMNDTDRAVYTDEKVLPYFNIALAELKEIFQQNNVPLTNETSAIITVPAGTSTIVKNGLVQYPPDLVEIQEIWESQVGQNNFTPMARREFLPHSIENDTTISQFLIWAWIRNEIRLVAANQDNDLKLDYVASIIVTPLLLSQLPTDYPVLDQAETFLIYKTAAVCSMFIGENETRAGALSEEAQSAIDRSLGISHKGRQAITTRHRPFRASWKNRGYYGY